MSTLPQKLSPTDRAGDRSHDRRGQDREAVVARTIVRDPGAGAIIHVETRNLSASGCQFASSVSIPVSTRISLGLAGAGSAAGIVVRSEGPDHACLFDRPLSPDDQARAFTGTLVVRLGCQVPPTPLADHRLPRHWRYRLVLALGALSWFIPVALFAAR